MTRRKALQLLVGIAVSVFFVWLILRSIPLSDVLSSLRNVSLSWMGLALVAFLLGYAARIARWRMMLGAHNPDLGWGRCAVPFMASIAANNVLPFRAGDAMRAVAFSGWLGVPTARVLATLVAERMMDLLSLLLAFALVFTVFQSENARLEALLGWGAAPFLFVAILIALLLLYPSAIAAPANWVLALLGKAAPAIVAKVQVQTDRIFHTLQTLAEKPRMAMMMVWSFLAWGFEASVFYATARALSDITVPIAAWLAMPVGTLSTMLPSTPGYIGTFHFFVMQAMEALGNSEVAAAAFAVLVHLALYVPATLIGGLCFCYWILTRASSSEAAPEEAHAP